MTVRAGRRVAGHLHAAWRLGWESSPAAAVGLVLTAAAAGALPVAMTWLTKLVIDGLAAPNESLTLLLAGLALTGVAAGALPIATVLLQQIAGRAMDLRLQTDLLGAVSRLDGLRHLADPEFRNQLDVASRCTAMTISPITIGLFAMGSDIITITGMVATLWTLSPAMSAVVLITTGPAVIMEIRYGRRQVALAGALSPVLRRAFFYSSMLTDLHAAKEARLLGLAGFMRDRLRQSTVVAHAEEHRLDVRVARAHILIRTLAAAVAAGGLVWCVAQAVAGRLTAGDVTAFVAAVGGVQASGSSLIGRLAQAVQAVGMFSFFRRVLAVPNDLRTAAHPRPMPKLRHGIEFRNVWFRYEKDQPWVLRGVNFTIPYGATVGLVGLNGAGKSTLIMLLCRFYDPQHGCILWDGTDISEVPVDRLRERMATLFQDYMAYDLSAAENIGLGDVTRMNDRAAVTAAARRADIDRVLSALPGGYDALLSRLFDDGEGGSTNLSGGQWQRVALARTLFRADRDLLILDEPGSGLDAEAEHTMTGRLVSDRGRRTNLLVSHRLGVIRRSDLIVVLAGGRVIEAGTHEQLQAAGGEYARLFHLQARGYAYS